MEILNSILLGFSIALQPFNLVYCLFGVLIGTLIGVLPGIGPVATISILLPITFKVPATSTIIMLAGIYYGAQYGGSTTAILMNIPGESSSVVTCLDGHQMAKQGRGGPALGIAAFGSFIAGILATVGLMLIAPPMAEVAVRFGPPEYVSLMILGLSTVALLSKGSTLKALIMAAFGMFLGTVGMDPIYARVRFTFGVLALEDGIGIVPLVMGLFGISEILLNIEASMETPTILKGKIQGIFPSIRDWRESIWAILRGSFLGFFFGLLPGGGAMVSSFISYAVEKRISKHPEKFGYGAIEGVAGPESANNAASQSAFVPLLSLGLPSNAVTAIILGALLIHNIPTGPLLISSSPDLFWGVVVSMIVGNGMLLVLNLPLIPLWIKLLKVPYDYLFPLILLFCIIGSYSFSNTIADVIIMLIFGLIGYFFRKFDYESAPLVLAMILAPIFERALGQSLKLSGGSFVIFLARPISLGFLIGAFLFYLIPHLARYKQRIRDSGFDDAT
jgi:putative tricarboxylic transport membrane protein